MGMESVWLRQLCYGLRPYYHNASDCEKIIIEHACIAGAGALIPFPVASVIVIVGSTYSMFIRIFTKLGITLKKNIGKTIVSYITTSDWKSWCSSFSFFTTNCSRFTKMDT